MDKTATQTDACRRCGDNLVTDGPLADETRHHLEQCPACAGTAALLARLPATLTPGPLAPDPLVPSSLQQAVARRRRASRFARIRSLVPAFGFPVPRLRLLAGAATACALLLAAHALQGRPSAGVAPTAPQVAAFAADSLVSLDPGGRRALGLEGDSLGIQDAMPGAKGRNDSI